MMGTHAGARPVGAFDACHVVHREAAGALTRPRRVLGIVLALAAAGHAVAGAQVRYQRAGRLAEWIAAVDAHEPQRDDAAVAQVRELTRAELQQVRGALPGVAQLMQDPGALYFIPAPPPGAEARQMTPVMLHPSDLPAFRDAAATAARRGRFVHLLARAAVLHTDASGIVSGGSGGRGRADPDAGTFVRFFDGATLDVEATGDHWEFARQLLDMVTPASGRAPDPSGDAFVRTWYQATVALLVARQHIYLRHVARALELFPTDRDVLFLAAALHEFVATAQVQAAIRSQPVANLGVRSSRDELGQAESLFRRALAADAGHVEARLRLGRVLALLGRPRDAARELRAAVGQTRDPLLIYYGELFLGDVHESLGDLEAAERSYERARVLYPGAQSPMLALGQVRTRGGDAGRAFEHVAAATAARDDAGDPWWMYHAAAGRDAASRLASMYAAAGEPAP